MMTTKTPRNDRLALFSFLISVVFLTFALGWAVGEYKLFPYRIVSLARQGFAELRTQGLRKGKLSNKSEKAMALYYKKVPLPYPPSHVNTNEAFRGLNLVTRVAKGLELKTEVMDMDGTLLHVWNIDWFKIWPDATHLPKAFKPKNSPGTHLHGAVIMENGDLVFNFDHLGLVRLGLRGEVVWRLPYQTHHSVHRQGDGNLWVCGQKQHDKPDARFPNLIPPFTEHTVLEVTPDGAIANEWSVPELLQENGYTGLLYIGPFKNDSTKEKGDVLHMNDAEPFPDTMEEAYFKKGDVLVSLRNINTVFTFNRHTRKITFICTGTFVWQHDPDFIDGNRFSVFDNNKTALSGQKPQSRIMIVSAPDHKTDLYYQGSKAAPFYTDIMGKHQWLPNGNLLITEARNGRAFEINPEGKIVWDYRNIVDQGVVGLVEEVQRVPLDLARFFNDDQRQTEAGQ